MPPWLILLYSIIIRAASSARTEVVFKMAWMCVPRDFWCGVWVGWRRRMAWVDRRREALLRRGWAEKRMRGWMKMEAQIVAVSCLLGGGRLG